MLHQCDAIRLFVERARAVQPAFALTESNAADVAQICRRLDGIPLAIELAAARVKALSTCQISSRLDNRFRLLTGGSRTALPRQQTLRATIDWSYALLSEAEQKLLRALSVFMDGWTLEGAEDVCACEDLEVIDGLALLVNKSLVETTVDGGEVRRYRLLETVRQYAQEKLDESEEAAQVRDRHLAHFLKVSRQIEQSMLALKGFTLIRSLENEVNNFRAALGWAFGSGESAIVFSGLQLASNLYLYFLILNLFSEGLSWIKNGLGLLDEGEERFIQIRAKAYACAADIATLLDEDEACGQYARESVQLYQKCKNVDPTYLGIALALYALHIHSLEPKRPANMNDAEAQALGREAMALVEKSGDPWGVFIVAQHNAYDALYRKNYQEVLLYNEIFAAASQGTEFEGVDNFFLALVAQKQGDYAEGLTLLQKVVELGRVLNMKVFKGWVLLTMGDFAMALNKVELAWDYYHESMTIAREIGKKYQFAHALSKLAELSLSKGRYQQAGEFLEQGLILAPEMDRDILAFDCLFPLLIVAEGIVPAAKMARLLGYIDQVIEDDNITLVYMKARYDQVTAKLQAQLTPDIFQTSVEAGRRLTVEQVQAEARAVVREVASYHPA